MKEDSGQASKLEGSRPGTHFSGVIKGIIEMKKSDKNELKSDFKNCTRDEKESK